MALVYDAAVVDRFVALVTGTTTYAVPLVTAEELLPAPLTAIAPGVRIDPFHNILTSAGPLSAATRTALNTATASLTLADVEEITAPASLTAFKAALTIAFQGLQDAADADLDDLDDEFPELKALYDTLLPLTNPAAQAAAIVVGILPELRASLRGTALRTALATATKADIELLDALASDPDVLHADGDPTASFLDDLAGLDTPLALDANGTHELRLDPPASADFLLYIAAPTGTSVTLDVDGVTAIPTTPTDADGELRSAASFALTAGDLVPVTLTLAGLPAGQVAELRWRTNGLAKAAIPASRVYDAGAYVRAERTLRRVQKTVLAAKALGLTAGEVADLGAVRIVTAGLWNGLAVDGTIAAADVEAQWARLAWVLWFVRLKKEHEPENDTFLGILRDPEGQAYVGAHSAGFHR